LVKTWGASLKGVFKASHTRLEKEINRARKYTGVQSGSYIKTEVHRNDYVAIVGDKPSESSTLIVKIGYGFGFNPDNSIWELETYEEGYAV
jgi:hypothetical protein